MTRLITTFSENAVDVVIPGDCTEEVMFSQMKRIWRPTVILTSVRRCWLHRLRKGMVSAPYGLVVVLASYFHPSQLTIICWNGTSLHGISDSVCMETRNY